MDISRTVTPLNKMWIQLGSGVLWCATMARAQDDDVTTTTILPSSFPIIDDYSEEIIPKTVVTIVCFAGAILLGMVVAKLVEVCHERASISDNASDMSDYTRELLKAQLMLAFNKATKGKKQKPEDIARRYGKLWFGKMMRNKARKIKASKGDEQPKGANGTNNSPSKDSGKSGNFLTVPGKEATPKKTPGFQLKVIDETKKKGNLNVNDPKARSQTVTPPTANTSFSRTPSTRTPNTNSVAPIADKTNAGNANANSPRNATAPLANNVVKPLNNGAGPNNTTNKPVDTVVTITVPSTAASVKPSQTPAIVKPPADTKSPRTGEGPLPGGQAEEPKTKVEAPAQAPTPVKAPVKATVTKTNVGSRPVSSGLKRPGVARPVSSKPTRPPTAKSPSRPPSAKSPARPPTAKSGQVKK